jgi:hypothetical protein
MIELNWKNEDRSTEPHDYLNHSRRGAFLRGWTIYLETRNTVELDVVHWEGLGMVYASVLGNITIEDRKQLYRLLLRQYLATENVKHWTDEQRKEILRKADEG